MIRRLVAGGVLAVAGLLLLPAPAQAHPLGNFTTNQYAGLRITASGVDIDYVLDLAELPAYQAQQGMTADYGPRTCGEAAAATTITVAGRTVRVEAGASRLSHPPGTGGLKTLRLECVLHADARITGETTVGYAGTLFTDRIGWREVTAIGDRTTILRSDVPAGSLSARLTAYPADTATSDVRKASLTVRPGGPAAAAPALPGRESGSQARDVDRITAWFTGLIGRPQLTLGVGIVAFLIAVILGGIHAVAPGHGKTIMAAYLVGSRGRLSHALTVAGTVAATHTVGVLALGVLLATSLQLAPDVMYEGLRLVSGVLVALVGAHLLYRAIRSIRARRAFTHHHDDHDGVPAADQAHGLAAHPAQGLVTHPAQGLMTHSAQGLVAHSGQGLVDHPSHGLVDLPAHGAAALPVHDHGHDHDRPHGHAHDHPHDHDHDHDHAHAGVHAPAATESLVHSHGGKPHTHYFPALDEPLSMRTLLAMGFAGGLSPSPSAVVVLLGAAALGRTWYGVLLVLAYGIGLAATLTGLGFALARWGDRLHRVASGRWSRLLTHRMPAATASIILAVGLAMIALSTTNLLHG